MLLFGDPVQCSPVTRLAAQFGACVFIFFFFLGGGGGAREVLNSQLPRFCPRGPQGSSGGKSHRSSQPPFEVQLNFSDETLSRGLTVSKYCSAGVSRVGLST